MHSGWGRLPSYMMIMVSLMCRCIKCVLGLVWLVNIPWKPSIGYTIYLAVLRKGMRYVLGVVFSGSFRVALLIYLPWCDLQWASKDNAAIYAAHLGNCTRCWWFAWYEGTSPIIRCMYVASKFLPKMWTIWKTILKIFVTLFFSPTFSKSPPGCQRTTVAPPVGLMPRGHFRNRRRQRLAALCSRIPLGLLPPMLLLSSSVQQLCPLWF